MENILNKALSEVLTVRYSDELRDAFDTGYAASDEFEARMRELIRKTDRPPIYRYTKVIASLAAVAVIAVGAAFIVPALTRSSVTVSAPETTAASSPAATISGTVQITTETAPDIVSETSDTSGTSAPDMSEETSDTNETSAEQDAEVIVDDDTTATTTAQTTSTTAATSSETTDGNEELTVEPTDDSADVAAEGETDSDQDADDDLYDDGDDDDDIVNESDSDDIITADDDDVAYDEPATETAKNVNVNTGDTLDSVFTDNFGTAFADLYADSGIYSSGGKNVSLNFYRNDYAFIQEILHTLGSAEADTSGAAVQDEGKPTLSLHITNVPNSVHRYTDMYTNNSSWLHYKDYFAVPLNDEDDDIDTVIDDDEDDSDYNISFQIKIYSGTGAVGFTQNLWYADREANTSDMYIINNVFYMDMSVVNKLFERCEKMFMPANAKTVGDIIDGLGLNADGISQACASVRNIYDTDLRNAKIGYSFIAELFEKYRKSRVTSVQNQTSSGAVDLTVVTKTNAMLTVKLNTDRTVYITDGLNSYTFKASFDDIAEALHAVEAANGIKIPMYSTLSDYLKGKGFDKLTKIEFAVYNAEQGKTEIYTLTDEVSLEKIRKLIVSEAEKAEYITDRSLYSNSFVSSFYVSVNGWRSAVRIEGDALMIQSGTRNVFTLSAGFTDKLKKLVMEDENVIVVTSDDDDEEYEDDVEPVDDENPVTD